MARKKTSSPSGGGGRGGRVPITVKINGESYTHMVEPRMLLVHYIRDVVGLTGTHVGCESGNCGACTIIVDGKSMKSCTRFAVQADGADVKTIEGLSEGGELHPIQKAFWDNHGLQCGFCTPGFIMQAYWYLGVNPQPTEQQIRYALTGNLCRCTGYQNIIKSVKAAAKEMKR
jgi:aerobic-type carbon monoxide dehydrogenase small subunit (CoxS/CutS family)